MNFQTLTPPLFSQSDEFSHIKRYNRNQPNYKHQQQQQQQSLNLNCQDSQIGSYKFQKLLDLEPQPPLIEKGLRGLNRLLSTPDSV